jgi:AGCS family alanine or glycine:cation symporter
VGIGNLAGVAGAIALGGPGSVFWMWISGLLGMVVKFAEVTLAVHFRHKNASGEFVGGPMYIIRQGMGKKWHFLAGIYCFFGVVAAFGVGNATQINAVISSIGETVASFGGTLSPAGNLAIGLVLALLIGFMLFGGAGRIGRIAELLVPSAAGCYVLLCIIALIVRADALPQALRSIFRGAFHPRAVTGGAVGSALLALRTGVSRGVFTNEAGMGTASIAHASANVESPVQQGLMGIMEVFIDTIVICTMTALVILSSGVPICYGTDCGAELTMQAFSAVFGDWICILITLALCLFAFATVLGWGLYGARCAQYLFGESAWRYFSALQMGAVVLGSVLNTGTIWLLAEIVNGLMAIPNLIALWALSSTLQMILNNSSGTLRAKGGTYENIHQCQSLRAFSHAEIPPAGRGCGKTG